MLEAQGLQDSLLLNNYDAAIPRLVVLFWRFHDLAAWGGSLRWSGHDVSSVDAFEAVVEMVVTNEC